VVSSPDSGATWILDTSGLGGGEPSTIYFDQASDRVFVSKGYPSYGLYYKDADDADWTRVSSGTIGTNSGTQVIYLTTKGSKMLAAGYNKFFESADGGVTWTLVTASGYPANTNVAFASPPFIVIGSDLYMGAEGLRKSSDDGATWTRVDAGFNTFFGSPFVTTLMYDGTTLYAPVRSGDGHEIYTTTNLGTSWDSIGKTESWTTSIVKHNGALFVAQFGQDTIYKQGSINTGIHETATLNIGLFPNPAHTQLTIIAETNDLSAAVADLGGRIVLTNSRIINGKLDVSSLAPGIYVLSLTENTSGAVSSRRLVIAR
jgi:hypothetical protein